MMDLRKIRHAPDLVHAKVYCNERRADFWFKGSPENIASFLYNNCKAERIIISNHYNEPVIKAYGDFLDSYADFDFKCEINECLYPMRMEKALPLAVPIFTSQELDQGYCVDEEAICIYRHGENDYTLWNVYLPFSVMRQIMDTKKVTYDSVEDLFEQMPMEQDFADSRIHVLVWNRDEVARYTARVGEDFVEQFSDMGCSTRGTMKDIMDELNAPDEQLDIMWDDLTPETQERLFRMLGDNGNFDVVPIATVCAPEVGQGMTVT